MCFLGHGPCISTDPHYSCMLRCTTLLAVASTATAMQISAMPRSAAAVGSSRATAAIMVELSEAKKPTNV